MQTPQDPHLDTHISSLERLVFFSDAVFAIAITLLALEIRVPLHDPPQMLPQHLARLGSSIAVYALSFVVVGLYWMAHHRMFSAIVRFDYSLAWLNILLLLCVAFLPVPNAVFAHYWESPYAVLFYATSLAGASVASLLLWWYATHRRRHIAPHVQPRQIRYIYSRNVATLAVAALAVLVGFKSTMAAFAVLVLYALTSVVTSIVTERHHT